MSVYMYIQEPSTCMINCIYFEIQLSYNVCTVLFKKLAHLLYTLEGSTVKVTDTGTLWFCRDIVYTHTIHSVP